MPEEHSHGTFADGLAEPESHPEDEHVGAFSDGQAPSPDHDGEEGRFSEGVEQLADADPEKHVEGSFGDTCEC